VTTFAYFCNVANPALSLRLPLPVGCSSTGGRRRRRGVADPTEGRRRSHEAIHLRDAARARQLIDF
jgi:hypothetical protein